MELLLKASADPNHTTMVSVARKQYLYQLIINTFGCIILQQEEVGGVTHRVLCTWQLLGLAVKEPRLAPSGPILALAA